jgi:hypothetical protein
VLRLVRQGLHQPRLKRLTGLQARPIQWDGFLTVAVSLGCFLLTFQKTSLKVIYFWSRENRKKGSDQFGKRFSSLLHHNQPCCRPTQDQQVSLSYEGCIRAIPFSLLGFS